MVEGIPENLLIEFSEILKIPGKDNQLESPDATAFPNGNNITILIGLERAYSSAPGILDRDFYVSLEDKNLALSNLAVLNANAYIVGIVCSSVTLSEAKRNVLSKQAAEQKVQEATQTTKDIYEQMLSGDRPPILTFKQRTI